VENVPRAERDRWLDAVFGLDELPDDGPELPRGCVPYVPCSVNTLLCMIELADVKSSDVFVDIGSGLGRAAAVTHFLTGAGAIGIEVQPALTRGSRELTARLNARRVAVVEGDAANVARYIAVGSVFFHYCPFSGERLERLLDDIEWIAQTRTVRVCTVDVPLPARPWLTQVARAEGLAVYHSVTSGAR
jgi:hypothetical protein